MAYDGSWIEKKARDSIDFSRVRIALTSLAAAWPTDFQTLREVIGLSLLEQTTLELSYLAELCLKEVYSGWFGEYSRRWGKPQTDFAVLGMGKFGGQELNYSSDIDVIFLYGEEGSLNPRFTN